MKLVIQIPCYNEEATLPEVLASIPDSISGIDQIEILVIDDGSKDRTVEVAKQHSAVQVISNIRNLGLAQSFRRGLDKSLKMGADIIVNIDGDNQYKAERIPDLIAPILAHQADIVIGDRKTDSIAHFSPLKKLLQKLGSALVRRVSKTHVQDAVSGFRAFSREGPITDICRNLHHYGNEHWLSRTRR